MGNHIIYREISREELNVELFAHFCRRQVVKDCWRKVDGEWVVRPDPFIDDWSEEDYHTLAGCLQNTLDTGGFVLGAFQEGRLKGFVSVESEFFGGENQYLDLSCIHVSQELRGQGTGRALFRQAMGWAKAHGAKKLYISAHSAVESQAFYRAMGCVEAKWQHPGHVAAEPFDCQLEKELL